MNELNLNPPPMKTVKSTLALGAFTLLLVAGFTPSGKLNVKTGTYGSCSCGEGSARVELTLNEDQTFRYFNNTDAKNKIDATGKWSVKGNTIVLEHSQPGSAIVTKWKVDDNEKCLKSRKGLAFTRLCHLKSCE
jgi:hypothetical protein